MKTLSSPHRLLVQDKDNCVGELPALQKLWIACRLLRNPAALVLDKLKLRRDILYETRSGIRFRTRAGTTDINEAVVVLAEMEYPPGLLHISDLPAPVVLDCGGHIGTFTLLVKTLNRAARIYTVEPLEENLRLLRDNLKMNGIQDVTVIGKALHSKSGHLSLYVSETGFDSASTSPMGHAASRAITVATTTLEDIVSTHAIQSIDLLKVDVEGSEYDIVDASFALLCEKTRRVVMEYHVTAAHPHGRDEIVSRLTSHGEFSLVYETKNLLGFHNRRFP